MMRFMLLTSIAALLHLLSLSVRADPPTTHSAESEGSGEAMARAAAVGFVESLRARDAKQVTRALYADTDADKYIVEAVATIAVAEAHFQDQIVSKFGEKAADGAWSFSKRVDAIKAAEFESIDVDRVQIILDVNGKTQTFVMKRIEKIWRVPTSSVAARLSAATPPDVVALRYAQMAELYDRAAKEVGAGNYKTARSAITATVVELSKIANGDEAQN